MSISVKYFDAPIGAQERAQASASAAQPFGSDQKITTGVTDTPFATLEPFSWKLDGSRILWSENPKDVGWWSKEKTDENGYFADPPTIVVNFPQPYTATGITISFWPSLESWCSEIEVTWFDGQTVRDHIVANPDVSEFILRHTVEYFDKFELKLIKTNMPEQFAKIQQIQIGQVIVFLQDELTRVSLLNEVDPSLCELSTDTMKIEILEKKDRELIPQKNQAMQLFRDGIQIASQFITDSSRENKQFYTFSCQSAIGRLEDEFLGGVYEEYSLDSLLSQVLSGFLADWSSFKGQTVTGYLPVCTKREALQQIAFAIGAAVTTQGDGTIQLTQLENQVSSNLAGSNIFAGAKVVREAQTATVQIVSHRYAKSAETENLLEDEKIEGSSVVYVFNSPHYDYQISGGRIDDSGENWVKITASGYVTLSGKKYVHSTSVRKIENKYATVAEKGNVLSVDDATLIHSENVDAALSRLYAFSMLKNVLTEDIVVSGQKSGQKVTSQNPWGTVTEGYITSMESEFTNTGHTASIQIRGREVQA